MRVGSRMNIKTKNDDNRVYGLFKCKKCRRHWESGNTWVGYGQKCKSCNIIEQPYETRPLEKNKSSIVVAPAKISRFKPS